MASSQTISDLRFHERFYFSDGSLHLLVEDLLYCVHGSLFEIHASKFPVHGNYSSGNPYALKDVKQIDFDRLLACLYPRTLLVREAKTSEEWTSILKLASKWEFESLRSRAIRKIKRTLNTPVDMVAFGRQYDIQDILLPGYATLCQSNVPLTYEEGLRLGMKDVIDISRIRHELYSSDITPVSFEAAIEKVKAFTSNEGRKDDAAAETAEQHDASLDDEQTSVWSNVESANSPQALLAEDDRELEAVILMADTDSPLAATTVDVEKLEGSESEHRSPHASSQSDASGSQGGDAQLTLQDVPNTTSQCLKLLDELTMDNFDVVSVKILQWVNANDSQTLYHVTRSIVDNAVKKHGQIEVCVHLCKEMIKKVSGKVRDNITKKSKSTVITGGPLFREHLGEVCQKELEGVVTSATAALTRSSISLDSLPKATTRPEVRRVRLIEFIRQLSDLTSEAIISRAIIKKWIDTLLVAEDAKNLVTLSMLLDSAGPRWDALPGKKSRMNSCFAEMTKIAQKTDNARLRTLLQDVIERRNKGWVVNKTAQRLGDLAEKRRASISSEDELPKTSKGGRKRSGERDMLAFSDEEPDEEMHWFAANRLRSLGPVRILGRVGTTKALDLDY